MAQAALLVETKSYTVRTNWSGDAPLDLHGNYRAISVALADRGLQAVPWGSESEGWWVRMYRHNGRPVRRRRVHLKAVFALKERD